MSDKSIQVDSISGGFIITAQAHESEAWERSVAVDPEVAVRRVAEFLGVSVLDAFAPTEDSPEQPKDTSNEDSTEATVEGDDPFDGVIGQFPLGPAAKYKASEFMGFTVTEKELPEGVLAEAVSANGEKVVITE